MHAALASTPGLEDLGDIEVEAVVELGTAQMPMGRARQLKEGDVVTLDRFAGEPVRVRLNGQPFADAEIVCVTDLLAARLTHLVPPPEGEVHPSGGDSA